MSIGNFDPHFNRTRRTAKGIAIVALLVNIAIIGFIGWVAFKILQHFGIV